MDPHYGNPVHMATLSMQSHQQPSSHQHYTHQGQQYQQLYQDYAESYYQSPAYHDASFPAEQYAYHPTASVPYGTGIESYLDPKYAANPAAFASRLPYLPFHAAAVAAYGMYDYSFEPAFIRKRNERERQRVKCVNEGYARLREHLPDEFAEKRLSKVETLRGAIMYINKLQTLLGFDPEKRTSGKKKNEVTQINEENEKSNIEEQNDENSEEISIKRIDSSDDQEQKLSSPENENEDDFQLVYAQENQNKASKSDIKVEPIVPSAPEKKIPQNFESDDLFHNCAQTRYKSCMKQSNLNNIETSSSTINLIDFPQNQHFFSEDSNATSRFDCQVEEDNRQNSNIGNLCTQRNNRRSSSLENSESNSDASRWIQPGAKRQSILNIAEELSHKAYTKQLSNNNDSETFNVMLRNSRHHPYNRKFNFINDSPPRWNGSGYVKSENSLPYNRYNTCDQQNGYSYQQHRCNYSPRIPINSFSSRTYPTSTDGQSDGFKSDTSPESSAGQSP